MSKSLVLTMTPQLGLTSQNPSAYYWRPKYLPLGGPTSRLIVDILGSRKIDIDCTNFTWVFPLQKKAALGLFLASSKMECVTFLEGFTTECISLY